MTIDEFIVFFRTLFDSDFSEELTPETEFRYLDDWGSLMAVVFIAEVLEKYGKIVPTAEMRKTETIEELHRLVSSL